MMALTATFLEIFFGLLHMYMFVDFYFTNLRRFKFIPANFYDLHPETNIPTLYSPRVLSFALTLVNFTLRATGYMPLNTLVDMMMTFCLVLVLGCVGLDAFRSD